MPVVFEQPDVISSNPAASAAGGLVQQYAVGGRLLNEAASIAERGASAAAGRQTQQNIANMQAAQQGSNAQSYGQITPAMQFQAQQQQDMQAKQQAFQAAEQANQFTYADQMYMNRLQGGLTQLKGQLADGTISQQEFDEGKSQLYGVLGPLTLKAQAAKTQAQQEQTSQLAEAAKSHAVGSKTFQDFMAQNPNGYKIDQDNGFAIAYKQNGDPVFHPLAKPDKNAALPDAIPGLDDEPAAPAHKASSAASHGASGQEPIPFDDHKEWESALGATKDKETGRSDVEASKKIYQERRDFIKEENRKKTVDNGLRAVGLITATIPKDDNGNPDVSKLSPRNQARLSAYITELKRNGWKPPDANRAEEDQTRASIGGQQGGAPQEQPWHRDNPQPGPFVGKDGKQYVQDDQGRVFAAGQETTHDLRTGLRRLGDMLGVQRGMAANPVSAAQASGAVPSARMPDLGAVKASDIEALPTTVPRAVKNAWESWTKMEPQPDDKAERRKDYKEKLQRLEGKDDVQSKLDRAMLKMALERLGD